MQFWLGLSTQLSIEKKLIKIWMQARLTVNLPDTPLTFHKLDHVTETVYQEGRVVI